MRELSSSQFPLLLMVVAFYLALPSGCAGLKKKPAVAVVDPFLAVSFSRCYDGDTCTATIPGVPAVFGAGIGIRLRGIDTPELRGKCPLEKKLAIAARDRARELVLLAEVVRLEDVGRGKYFRLVARIIADGRDVSQVLLEEGHAVVYDGGTKVKDWCAP